ncbi:MAG: response regulator transcription factor [Vicinamibacteria bacterium]|nr:response regulator transcription factor [Vicinamibacteria bacterium]
MSARILVVEDEPGLVLTLEDRLRAEGYVVGVARDGADGFNRASAEPWDLILLDGMLPRKSGFDVCRDLRAKGVKTPVLMLTARGQVSDRVVGLKLGADDYLVKPFDMSELLARIEARLRRDAAPPGSAIPNTLTFGRIQVDFRRAEVTKSGAPVELSGKELHLLRYFLEHPRATLSRTELLEAVWGYSTVPFTRTVDVHVANLRRKLEDDPARPSMIHTIHGLGYKFVVPA